MDRPSISVMSPTSPGALRDLPLVLPGQLSVSATLAQPTMWLNMRRLHGCQLSSPHLMFTGEAVVRQGGPSVERQRSSSHRSANTTRRTASEPLRQDVLPARQKVSIIWERKVMSALVFVFTPKQAWTLMNLSIREKAGRAVLFLVDDYGLTVWIGKHFKWHSLLWLYIQYIPIYFFRFLNLYQNHED